jgi:hypothetical protein
MTPSIDPSLNIQARPLHVALASASGLRAQTPIGDPEDDDGGIGYDDDDDDDDDDADEHDDDEE